MQKHEWRDNPALCCRIKTAQTKTKWLNENLGGNWTYEGRGGFFRQWRCDDGRVIRYTAPPVDEFDNICGPSQCWIDTPGKPTEPFNWMITKTIDTPYGKVVSHSFPYRLVNVAKTDLRIKPPCQPADHRKEDGSAS